MERQLAHTASHITHTHMHTTCFRFRASVCSLNFFFKVLYLYSFRNSGVFDSAHIQLLEIATADNVTHWGRTFAC